MAAQPRRRLSDPRIDDLQKEMGGLKNEFSRYADKTEERLRKLEDADLERKTLEAHRDKDEGTGGISGKLVGAIILGLIGLLGTLATAITNLVPK